MVIYADFYYGPVQEPDEKLEKALKRVFLRLGYLMSSHFLDEENQEMHINFSKAEKGDALSQC